MRDRLCNCIVVQVCPPVCMRKTADNQDTSRNEPVNQCMAEEWQLAAGQGWISTVIAERPSRHSSGTIVFLDHVQNLHIHAVRANFHLMFARGSTAVGRSRATRSAIDLLTAPFSPDSEPVGL